MSGEHSVLMDAFFQLFISVSRKLSLVSRWTIKLMRLGFLDIPTSCFYSIHSCCKSVVGTLLDRKKVTGFLVSNLFPTLV